MKRLLIVLVLIFSAPLSAEIPINSSWLYYGKDFGDNEQCTIDNGWYLGDGWNGQTGTFDGFSVMIGGEGSALFSHTNGVVSGINALAIGYAQGGSGLWVQSGGEMNCSLGVIGSGGDGEYVQTGGYHYCSLGIALGVDDSQNYATAIGGAGTYYLSGGVLETPRIWIGESLGCSGDFIMSGGELIMTNSITHGEGTGQFLMSGGILKSTYYSPEQMLGLFDTVINATGEVVISTEGLYTTAYVTPEPATILFFGLGLISLRKLRR